MVSAVSRSSSSRPRGTLRCVERCCPSAAQARRSETCSCARTCSMQARRLLAASSGGRVSAASNAELAKLGTQFSEVAFLLLREWDPNRRAGRPSFFFRRKSKHEKRGFICERRLRNPHAPRFSAPKIFRGAVAQYL